MQLLIVHDDAEVGEQLMTIVKDYTAHRCDLVDCSAAARHWAEKHQRCDLLLVQFDGNDIDGLTLAGALSEPFDGLQTFFFPRYPANRRRVEVAKTKVFPEPIEGERLLEAINEAEKTGPGPDLFDVVDLLQMCCLSGRDGAIQLVQKSRAGIIYLRAGQIMQAESTTVGIEALQEMLTWGLVEFAYDPTVQTKGTMSLSWDQVNLESATRSTEEKAEAIKTNRTESAEATEPPKKRGFLGLFRRS